jgi:hypothetical protein
MNKYGIFLRHCLWRKPFYYNSMQRLVEYLDVGWLLLMNILVLYSYWYCNTTYHRSDNYKAMTHNNAAVIVYRDYIIVNEICANAWTANIPFKINVFWQFTKTLEEWIIILGLSLSNLKITKYIVFIIDMPLVPYPDFLLIIPQMGIVLQIQEASYWWWG